MKKTMVVVSIVAVALVAFSGCQRFRRFTSDVESSLVGLNRVVTAYSLDGKVLGRWEGRIDISPAKCEGGGCVNRVLFQLPNGKRVIVYNGTVVTEEK